MSADEFSASDRAVFGLRVSQMEPSVFGAYDVSCTADLIERFAKLVGDFSPIHVDAAYATAGGFEGRVVHGLLLASLFSRLVGMYIPGATALILETHFEYVKPVTAETRVTFSGVVEEVSPQLQTVKLKLLAFRDDEVFVRGSVLVRVREEVTG